MKLDNKKVLLLLLANTVILMVLYFWFPSQFHFSYMPMIYLAVGAVLALYYVIYNRGFVGKNLSPDMLAGSMTLEEKQEFIRECKERQSKSKWVLTILVPLMLVFAVDMIYLFVLPLFSGWFQ
ncbi:MAG: hypothetical protein E7637_00865 [Ruminococcaceae bacterium]|nr:hypothetical protein [Oscillospiraceae bacterium]